MSQSENQSTGAAWCSTPGCPRTTAGCPRCGTGAYAPAQQPTATAWDGYPPDPTRAGYHWLRRTDAVSPMPAVIWTWRPEVQTWRWKGEEQISPEEQAATKEYIAPVTDHAEVERLRAEVASLRLTLGGRTFAGQEVPDPIGCPMPGACAQVAEIGRLRAVIRVNGLRVGATHAEIDEVIYGKR